MYFFTVFLCQKPSGIAFTCIALGMATFKNTPQHGDFLHAEKIPRRVVASLGRGHIPPALATDIPALLMSLLRGRGSAARVCWGGMSHAVRIQLLHGSQVAPGCQVLPGGKLLGLEVKAMRCTLIYST